MNYTYDEHGRPVPSGGPGGYIIQFATPQPQQDQFGNPVNPGQKLDPQWEKEYHRARLRNMHASARPLELSVILDGMKEVRSALNINSIQVADGDTGSGERPPLVPAFDDVNRLKLQNCYLTLCERLVNYADAMLTKQLDVPITNEIKKVAKPAEEPKPQQ